MLLKFNEEVFRQVIFKYYLPLVTSFVLVYIFKLYQSHYKLQANFMALRVWYCLIFSQIGFAGALVMIIWNYNKRFQMMVDFYNIYSSYICLVSIINSKHENKIAAVIVTISFLSKYCP